MRNLAPLICCLAALAGCTSTALRRQTFNQAMTVSDLRYQQVVDGLALLADNSGAMVTFSIIDSGSTFIQDTVTVDSATAWTRVLHGFSQDTLTLTGKRNPDLTWTLSPVASQPQLEGVRYAYLWQLFGPPAPDSEYMSLLRAPKYGEYTGFHLAVADQLWRIPPGWFHIGMKSQVPSNARYTGNCHGKYAWVCQEGMWGLSEFTLVLLDIATLDPNSLTLSAPYVSVQFSADPRKTGAAADPGKPDAAATVKSVSTTDNVPAVQCYCCQNGVVTPGIVTVQVPNPSAMHFLVPVERT